MGGVRNIPRDEGKIQGTRIRGLEIMPVTVVVIAVVIVVAVVVMMVYGWCCSEFISCFQQIFFIQWNGESSVSSPCTVAERVGRR